MSCTQVPFAFFFSLCLSRSRTATSFGFAMCVCLRPTRLRCMPTARYLCSRRPHCVYMLAHHRYLVAIMTQGAAGLLFDEQDTGYVIVIRDLMGFLPFATLAKGIRDLGQFSDNEGDTGMKWSERGRWGRGGLCCVCACLCALRAHVAPTPAVPSPLPALELEH